MQTEDLKLTLSKLRTDLANTSTSDPELRQMLLLLEQDIQRRLALAEHGGGETVLQADIDPEQRRDVSQPVEQSGLSERTQEISARFAVNHPRLEPILRELGAILERIGI